MSSPVILVAKMIAKPDQVDLVESTLKSAAPAVHEESGCQLYALHRKAGTTGEFVMIEKWASQEDLGAHFKGSVMREIGAVLKSALVTPPEVQLLEQIPAGDAAVGVL
ncbi:MULTISPECIES: putative quinol monooxygenase [Rhodococcus]|uniref:Antibiotic biosynthesis monooxygenase n=1 Tax=Rhodococcus qingshengii TaxID=334542 RepID=A0A2A5J095_RHOSG|nr:MULTISPECIES: putative quinol monooxygenase [Rhodococcus]MDJ0105186.1 putative quinol monooxygenase [Rhodococcus erythropolis]MDV8015352.1 putative quinol monooxygenase [Rhodococcus sp. IEGM 1241]PCK22421.1 antibiotic biosynthesis monooxygenase [Rhodococcus qingshengii]